MTLDVRQNADLAIQQWQTAPRLQTLITGLLGAIQESLINPLTHLEETQNLEQAERAGLDDIGERLVIARTQEVPTDIEFFGFDAGGTGFDQEPFFTTIIGYLLVEDEEDTAFRGALRARGRMLLGGASLTDFIHALEGGEAQYESIIDNGDGTFTITVTRQAEKTRIQDLINRKALPIPAGVGFTINVSTTTGDNVLWGTTTTPNDLSGFEAAATTYPYNQTRQVLPMPTFSDTARLVFAQRSSDPPVVAMNLNGRDQIHNFTRTQNAIQVNGVDYDVWVSDYDIIGSKVAGHQLIITR